MGRSLNMESLRSRSGLRSFGFSGRYGSRIDAIAPIWATNSPIEYRLTNVAYADLPRTAVNKENVQLDKTLISNSSDI
jgi:hypothetical protein